MSVGVEVREWLAENWNPELTVREWWVLLAESGYGAPMWPKQWFGLGVGRAEAIEVGAAFREAGAIGAPAGLGMLLAAPTILTHGPKCGRRAGRNRVRVLTSRVCRVVRSATVTNG